MKKVLALFLLLLLAAPVWGQEKMKIGFVDLEKAIQTSKAGKNAKAKFQAQVKKVEANLLKEKDGLEKFRADAEKKGLLLKEGEKRNLEREFQRKLRDYQVRMRDSQEELRQREREAMDNILKEIANVVSEVGKKEKFTLILPRSQMLYVDQGVDITQKVVALYDRKVGAGVAITK
ncbi:MAG: OmpH family outer membrane protein [Deltaproteobacteria bacterium]|nr:OmpH family outer membrane protein [Deltaproteobacteria bacterium]